MDVFLQARGQATANQSITSGKVERIVAQDQVVITEPARRATGQRLVYIAAEDKVVLTGGPAQHF